MLEVQWYLLTIFKSSKWSEPRTSAASGRWGVRVPERGDISNTWEVWGREQGKGMVRVEMDYSIGLG